MRYILIHGAWHGGWCWSKVAALLQQAGHHVATPDLPASGKDPTPLKEVTLEAYARRVCEVLDAHPEPAILVGHSLGGLTISQVAEARPEQVHTLVYLAAALLPNGDSLVSLSAKLQAASLALPYVRFEEQSTSIKEEALTHFYLDCSDEEISSFQSLLVPQATSIYSAPLCLTEARFGRIRRIYILCQRDQVISFHLQKEMIALMPCQTYTLDTGHFPFFSAPERVAEILLRAASS